MVRHRHAPVGINHWKQSSPWNSWVEYLVEDDGGRTVVRVHFEGKPTGRIRWLDPMPDSLATRVYRNDMQNHTPILDAETG